MIVLHRLNGKEFLVNAEHIKFLESTPDTLITLTINDEKFMVQESVDSVVNLIIEYKRKCFWFPKKPGEV